MAVGTVNVAEIFVAGTVIFDFSTPKTFAHTLVAVALALSLDGALTPSPAAYLCRKLPRKVLQCGVGVALISLNLGVAISQIK